MSIDTSSHPVGPVFGEFVRVANIDVTVVEVLSPSVFEDAGRLTFLDSADVGIGHEPSRGGTVPEYIIAGFPSTKAKRAWPDTHIIRAWPFGFRSKLLTLEEQAKYPFDPLGHLLLRFNKKLLFNERKGQYQLPPKLEGISGCGLWHIDNERLKLVGIVTAKHPPENPSAIVATRIDAITEAMRLTIDAGIPTSPILAGQVSHDVVQ